MPVEQMYVVQIREKGLFLVKPTAGQTKAAVIEAALKIGGGYSAGLVELDLPANTSSVWVVWVEGETSAGQPYFEYRTFPASLTEAEIQDAVANAGESVLKLHLSEILRPSN